MNDPFQLYEQIKTNPVAISRIIDHTLLKPESTNTDIKKICAEACDYQFSTVCVNPTYVRLAVQELKGCGPVVCTVVGFPLGANLPNLKREEAKYAIHDGASEIDMVMNIGAFKSGDFDLVYRDMRAVVEECEEKDAVSKIIIEAALLNGEEIVRACELAIKAKANYVKTSTGFGPGGATEQAVKEISDTVRDSGMGVKAAGGIKSFSDAQKMIAAGATRIGASAGIKIVQEAQSMKGST